MGGEYTYMMEQFGRNVRALDKSLRELDIRNNDGSPRTANDVLKEMLDGKYLRKNRPASEMPVRTPQ